jgi:hypothetical protein
MPVVIQRHAGILATVNHEPNAPNGAERNGRNHSVYAGELDVPQRQWQSCRPPRPGGIDADRAERQRDPRDSPTPLAPRPPFDGFTADKPGHGLAPPGEPMVQRDPGWARSGPAGGREGDGAPRADAQVKANRAGLGLPTAAFLAPPFYEPHDSSKRRAVTVASVIA